MKHKHYINISMMVMVILTMVLFSGCGLTSDTTSAPVAETEKISLDVWTFFDMNTPGDHYLTLWDDLAEQYGYDIHLQIFTTEQIKDKLEIALATKELPDIFLVWGGTYPDYLFDAGACIPVQDQIQQSGIRFKNAYTQTYKNGNNYIIPCLVEAYAVMYYNQTLLDEMHLSVPKTWDELLTLIDVVHQYNQSHGTSYAALELGNKDAWLGELLYCSIVNRLDPTAFDELIAGKRDIKDPVFLEGAKHVQQLVHMEAFNDNFIETGEVEAVENFVAGQAVLFPHQSTIMYYLNEHMKDTSIGMTQFPSCNPSYDDTYMQYMIDINHTLTPGLCISASSDYKDEATELCLTFSDKVNTINMTQYGYYNYTEQLLNMPSQLPSVVQQFHHMLDHSTQMTPYLYAVMERKHADTMRNLTRQLYAGIVDNTEFIDTADTCFQAIKNP